MARLIRGLTSGSFPDLDDTVGPSGPNARTDVGAIQYGLLILATGALGPMGRTGANLSVPGHTSLIVDGGYGPITAAFIAAYQAKRVKAPANHGGSLPTPNGEFVSLRNRAGWNLFLLDDEVRDQQKRGLLDIMASDSSAPKWLKRAFMVV